jgi:hypothetical protein
MRVSPKHYGRKGAILNPYHLIVSLRSPNYRVCAACECDWISEVRSGSCESASGVNITPILRLIGKLSAKYITQPGPLSETYHNLVKSSKV